MNNKPIGIFDSGIGGLTVLEQIQKELPTENLIYLADTMNFPYGPKSEAEIIKYSINNVEFLLSKGAKIIVIACGTATSYALKTLQHKFDVPIIGIIEPTISYVKTLKLTEIRCNCYTRNDKIRSLGKRNKTTNTRHKSYKQSVSNACRGSRRRKSKKRRRKANYKRIYE